MLQMDTQEQAGKKRAIKTRIQMTDIISVNRNAVKIKLSPLITTRCCRSCQKIIAIIIRLWPNTRGHLHVQGGGGLGGWRRAQSETPFQTICVPENIPENTLSLKENKWNLLFGLESRVKIKTTCQKLPKY